MSFGVKEKRPKSLQRDGSGARLASLLRGVTVPLSHCPTMCYRETMDVDCALRVLPAEHEGARSCAALSQSTVARPWEYGASRGRLRLRLRTRSLGAGPCHSRAPAPRSRRVADPLPSSSAHGAPGGFDTALAVAFWFLTSVQDRAMMGSSEVAYRVPPCASLAGKAGLQAGSWVREQASDRPRPD